MRLTPLHGAAGAALVMGVAAAVAWRASRGRGVPPAAAKPVAGPATLRRERPPAAVASPNTGTPLGARVPMLGWSALVVVLAVAWFGIPPRLESGPLPSQAIALAAAWLLATWLVFIPRYRRGRRRASPA